jgi:hypothetical protein
MNTVTPQGETVRKAVKWISEQLNKQEKKTIQQLLNEAIFRFDLSPKDAEFLNNFYRNHFHR